MKFRGLNYWVDPEGSEGLLFFAQLLEELLFDYSLDTYKPSAMNSSTLCLEAKKLIKDIEEELIDQSNLEHVLKELLFNLKKDEVAKSLLRVKVESLAIKFENKDTPLHEIAILLDIVYSDIRLDKYKIHSEKLLLEAVANPKEKTRISALTRNYITTLINYGYSTRFLYPSARMYFYWNKKKIAGPESIKGFFEIVNGVRQKYTAIFRVSTLFNEIKESCKPFKAEVVSQLSETLAASASNKDFGLRVNEAYLVVNEITSMDVFTARDEAERIIDQICTLSSLFHHKEIASWQSNTLLINLDSKKERIVTATPNPMLMCADSKKESAAIKLNEFVNNFGLKEKESFSRFNRAAELHALALRSSDSPENQLLNLWVALETIVPSKLGRTKAKVNNIIDSAIPFLSLTYIETLTERLARDFCLWNRAVFMKSIEDIDGDNERQRLIKLLLLPEYKKNKDQLFIEIRQFYLLRNRAHYLSSVLSNARDIASLLETHSQRVGWQIRRIYRTRNLIVHAGQTPRYINILIKNIHDYLDIIINVIGRLASEEGRSISIEEAFKYCEILYMEYLGELREGNGEVDADNIHKLLLSPRV